jgi:hypothetical protein
MPYHNSLKSTRKIRARNRCIKTPEEINKNLWGKLPVVMIQSWARVETVEPSAVSASDFRPP